MNPKKTMRVYKLHTDGSAELVEMPNATPDEELDSLQDAVGGYIELVRMTDDAALVVDEEGLCKGLEINGVATLLAGRPIVGPAVLVGIEHTMDGDVCTDCPPRFAEWVDYMMEDEE